MALPDNHEAYGTVHVPALEDQGLTLEDAIARLGDVERHVCRVAEGTPLCGADGDDAGPVYPFRGQRRHVEEGLSDCCSECVAEVERIAAEEARPEAAGFDSLADVLDAVDADTAIAYDRGATLAASNRPRYVTEDADGRLLKVCYSGGGDTWYGHVVASERRVRKLCVWLDADAARPRRVDPADVPEPVTVTPDPHAEAK